MIQEASSYHHYTKNIINGIHWTNITSTIKHVKDEAENTLDSVDPLTGNLEHNCNETLKFFRELGEDIEALHTLQILFSIAFYLLLIKV